MADDPDHREDRPGSGLFATLALAALLAALAAGVWGFPRFYAYMSTQDCIASGRTSCVALPAAVPR